MGISPLNRQKFELLYRVLSTNKLLLLKSNEELTRLCNSKVEDPPPLPHHARDAFKFAPPVRKLDPEPKRNPDGSYDIEDDWEPPASG
jgi:hypothetical protein